MPSLLELKSEKFPDDPTAEGDPTSETIKTDAKPEHPIISISNATSSVETDPQEMSTDVDSRRIERDLKPAESLGAQSDKNSTINVLEVDQLVSDERSPENQENSRTENLALISAVMLLALAAAELMVLCNAKGISCK